MENKNYDYIVSILMDIVSVKELANIIFVSGGIVPWLVSKKDSNRTHGDIDFIVSQENMPIIRKLLIQNNLYDVSLDSLNYEESESVDYGLESKIRGVPVGFYPFEQLSEDVIVQRSYSLIDYNGQKDFKVMEMPNMKISDYLARTTLPNGSVIGISSLEVIKATKEKANREKDISDIKEIDRIGYDLERYERVKQSIANMKSTLDERNLEKMGLK